MHGKHGLESVAYIYASVDGTCPVCMKLFGSRMKVVANLRRSSVCLLNHVAYDLAPSEEARQSAVKTQLGCQRQNRGQGRPLGFSRTPTLTMEGPMMPLFLFRRGAFDVEFQKTVHGYVDCGCSNDQRRSVIGHRLLVQRSRCASSAYGLVLRGTFL